MYWMAQYYRRKDQTKLAEYWAMRAVKEVFSSVCEISFDTYAKQLIELHKLYLKSVLPRAVLARLRRLKVP
jgi:hypothetical protein